MIIGNGLVAKAFANYLKERDVLIFASGVSNSKCEIESEFEREKKLLIDSLNNNQNSKFIYFSTCSIYDPDISESRYVKHKLEMESIIKKLSHNFVIFRISNLIGQTNNPNTIVSFLYHSIIGHKHFKLWKNTYRNIIDIDDVAKLCSFIINENIFKNTYVNIANQKNYSTFYIVKEIERFTKIKADYELVDFGSFFSIDISKIEPFFLKLNLSFDSNYFFNCLLKYYGK